MKQGFSLSDWVWYWMQEFGAITYKQYGEHQITQPVEDKWIDTLDFLETQAALTHKRNEGTSRKVNQAQDELDKLIGPRLLKYASEAYWETASYVDSDIPYRDWVAMSLEDRGRRIAYNRIKNALEGLSRYAMNLKSNSRAKTRKPKPKGKK